MIRVMAPDRATVETVVRRLMLYVDGRRGPVLLRDEESGVLALSGLSPNTSYTLTATMMDRPDASDFTPGQRFTTEKAPALPNSDFEDRKSGVVYDRLPSGGRYSQTEVAIYNWQNRESFSQQVPQKWANTNAKTFSTRASNHNTGICSRRSSRFPMRSKAANSPSACAVWALISAVRIFRTMRRPADPIYSILRWFRMWPACRGQAFPRRVFFQRLQHGGEL